MSTNPASGPFFFFFTTLFFGSAFASVSSGISISSAIDATSPSFGSGVTVSNSTTPSSCFLDIIFFTLSSTFFFAALLDVVSTFFFTGVACVPFSRNASTASAFVMPLGISRPLAFIALLISGVMLVSVVDISCSSNLAATLAPAGVSPGYFSSASFFFSSADFCFLFPTLSDPATVPAGPTPVVVTSSTASATFLSVVSSFLRCVSSPTLTPLLLSSVFVSSTFAPLLGAIMSAMACTNPPTPAP